jgi:hypothetical protein
MRIRLRAALLLAGATALVGAGLGLGLGLPASANGGPPAPPYGSGGFPHMDHVFVIMMENTPYTALLTPHNTHTTFIRSLARENGLETDYFGVTHTSLPNYVAATSGNTWGSNTDDEAQATLGYFNHLSLFDQFDQAGVSWKAYMQSMPRAAYPYNYGDCSTGANPTCTNGTGHHDALYVRKHNPPMQYPDIFTTSLADNDVPLTTLTTDLANNTVPQFAWISPNVCDDMHGGAGACPYPTTTATVPKQATLYQDGNNFLQTWVNRITSSRAWTGNSAIFITWDEGGYENVTPYAPKTDTGCCDSPRLPSAPVVPKTGSGGDLAGGTLYGGGHVPMIVVERNGPRFATDNAPANHYSLLQTIEMNFGLSFLGDASDTLNVHSLAPLLSRHR